MAKRRQPRSSRPNPAAPPPRKARQIDVATLAIFGVAFLLRAVAAVQLGALPISRNPQFDSLELTGWALRVAHGDFTWPVAPPHGPGYPYFLGALIAITGQKLLAVRLIQAALGALTCVSIARAGTRWLGREAGLAAGAILAVYAPLIWIDVSILSEGLLLFTTAAALWSMATERHPAITGALLGLAAVTRPTALLLLPLFLIAAARTWRGRAIAFAALCVVIAPVTIANWRTMHAFVPIQSFGGMNAYLGNSPHRDGLASARPGGDWDRIESDAVRHGATTAAEEEAYFTAKLRNEIAGDFGGWLEVLAKKLVWTFQAEEVRDTHSFYFFADAIPLLKWLPGFTILFALAAAGVIAAPRRYEVVALIALSALAPVALVAGARYRLPMVLGLALLAGAALTLRARKQIAIAAAVAVVGGLLAHVWRHAPSHNFAEELALTAEGEVKDGNLHAEETARQAVAADPNNALAWDALGISLEASQKPSEARDAFAHATQLNPDYAAAHLHFGNLLLSMKDENGAAREYALSAALSPHDPRPVSRLAPILARRGNVAGAQRLYARLVELSPGDAEAMMTLARLDGALGKPAEGLAAAQRAAEIRDPEPEEWLLMALLAAQSGKDDTAATALQRSGGQDTPEGVFITAMLRTHEHRYDEAGQLLDALLARIPNFEEARRLRAQIESEQQKRR